MQVPPFAAASSTAVFFWEPALNMIPALDCSLTPVFPGWWAELWLPGQHGSGMGRLLQQLQR